jgi:hypothetical protein
LNSLSRALNKNLASISANYGKLSSLEKFRSDDKTIGLFNNITGVQNYKAVKLNIDKSPHKNMLKPLRKFKEEALDVLSSNLFNLNKEFLQNPFIL